MPHLPRMFFALLLLGGVSTAGTIGLLCTNSAGAAKDNVISGFSSATVNCTSSGNLIN